jgi:hypothetical protein
VLVTDEGYTVLTISEFVMRIDPSNVGVLLRRRLDQFHGRQKAEVLVDDTFAGIWYDVYENQVLRFADSDVPLPASLTSGKDRIHVKVIHRGDVPWSAFDYSAYSYLSP